MIIIMNGSENFSNYKFIAFESVLKIFQINFSAFKRKAKRVKSFSNPFKKSNSR